MKHTHIRPTHFATARVPAILRWALTLTLSAALLAGCKEEDRQTRSVLYLDPDGAVSWAILEWDIQPGRGQPDASRSGEAKTFLLSARSAAYPVSVALDLAGATRSSTTVLKEAEPFEVYSLAQFRSLDVLFRDLYTAAGATVTSTLEMDGPRRLWTFVVHGEDGEALPGIEALADAVARMRVVLTRGHFLEARGFTILDDRTVEMVDGENPPKGDEALRLVWSTEPKPDK